MLSLIGMGLIFGGILICDRNSGIIQYIGFIIIICGLCMAAWGSIIWIWWANLFR